MTTRSTDECWGVAAFDNLAAHDLSYTLATNSPGLEDLADGLKGSRKDLQQLIAIGELINAIEGRPTRVAGSPLMLDWLEERPRVVRRTFVAALVARIESAARSSSLQRYWKTQSQKQHDLWLSEVETCLQLLQTPVRRPQKTPKGSKRKAQMLVKSLGGFCFNSGNSGEINVRIPNISPQQAVELTRYRHVNMLDINPTAEDPAVNPDGVRLLLQGWWRQLSHLEFDQTAVYRVEYSLQKPLLKLSHELSQLPALTYFSACGFLVNDKTIQALAANKLLSILSISKGRGPTNKSLKHLEDCKKLEQLFIYNSKITWPHASAFDEAHPKTLVRMTCMYE